MKTLTTIVPDIYADFDGVILIESPDGKYDILRFQRGQVIDDVTYWWAVGRYGEHHPQVFTTSLDEAMAWLAQRLLETCF